MFYFTQNIKVRQQWRWSCNLRDRWLCETQSKRKTDHDQVWTREADEAVKGIKKAVSSTPVLKYFDETKRVTIQCDASSTGLGAVLLQGGQPVTYASHTLSAAEQNYAQIEKELLAVLFALEKFDQYVYGRHVDVDSDHKPLQIITAKPILTAPKRL